MTLTEPPGFIGEDYDMQKPGGSVKSIAICCSLRTYLP